VARAVLRRRTELRCLGSGRRRCLRRHSREAAQCGSTVASGPPQRDGCETPKGAFWRRPQERRASLRPGQGSVLPWWVLVSLGSNDLRTAGQATRRTAMSTCAASFDGRSSMCASASPNPRGTPSNTIDSSEGAHPTTIQGASPNPLRAATTPATTFGRSVDLPNCPVPRQY